MGYWKEGVICMTVIKSLVRENAVGNRMEAVILQGPEGLSIKYYINHSYKHEDIFKKRDLNFVEGVANAWLSEVKTLNG
jgi:hypothetical protein